MTFRAVVVDASLSPFLHSNIQPFQNRSLAREAIMRVIVAGVFLLAAACGGGDPGGPTTSHALVGNWSYDMPQLQDGRGLSCSIMGPVLTLTQNGTSFSGRVNGGTQQCTWPDGSSSNSMPSADVLAGKIRGDSISFDILNDLWHNVGRFVTEDSMAGTVNSIQRIGAQQYQIVGYWYSKRQ
jgi:hypothetical protein